MNGLVQLIKPAAKSLWNLEGIQEMSWFVQFVLSSSNWIKLDEIQVEALVIIITLPTAGLCLIWILKRVPNWLGSCCRNKKKSKVRNVCCWGWQIKSQIMAPVFTQSQWIEDYPWASGTGLWYADSVWGFDRVGSSQSSVHREQRQAECWVSLRHLNTSNTDDWTAAHSLTSPQRFSTLLCRPTCSKNKTADFSHCWVWAVEY